MITISSLNQKGGCGKTTTAVNLAAGLSRQGFEVLLIDLDPQAHASFSLSQTSGVTINRILKSIIDGDFVPAEDDSLYVPVADNFMFIPSHIDLVSVENSILNMDDRMNILKKYVASVEKRFDYCVIDCPPNLGMLTLNAVSASSQAIIPITLCDFSLNGLNLIKNLLVILKEKTGRAPAPFYLLNQVDTRSNHAREFIEKAESRLGTLLLNTRIRNNIHLREAVSCGKHIFDHKPHSNGAEDFEKLALEISNINGRANWIPLFLRMKNLDELFVVGDFNDWQKNDNFRLHQGSEELWSCNIPLEKGRYRYKFVSGDRWFKDPHNQMAEDDSLGGVNSVLVVG